MTEEREDRGVKNRVIGLIRGTGEVAQAAIIAVSETVQVAVSATEATGSKIGGLAVDAVKGAIAAVGEVSGQSAETAADSVETAVGGQHHQGQVSSPALEELGVDDNEDVVDTFDWRERRGRPEEAARVHSLDCVR